MGGLGCGFPRPPFAFWFPFGAPLFGGTLPLPFVERSTGFFLLFSVLLGCNFASHPSSDFHLRTLLSGSPNFSAISTSFKLHLLSRYICSALLRSSLLLSTSGLVGVGIYLPPCYFDFFRVYEKSGRYSQPLFIQRILHDLTLKLRYILGF